jgi:5-carboxymethyl-2-hydroxymuconate isomerase
MPHLIVDYLPGVFATSELALLLLEINEAVVGSGAIKDEADLKARAVRCPAMHLAPRAMRAVMSMRKLRLLPGRGVEMR